MKSYVTVAAEIDINTETNFLVIYAQISDGMNEESN